MGFHNFMSAGFHTNFMWDLTLYYGIGYKIISVFEIQIGLASDERDY